MRILGQKFTLFFLETHPIFRLQQRKSIIEKEKEEEDDEDFGFDDSDDDDDDEDYKEEGRWKKSKTSKPKASRLEADEADDDDEEDDDNFETNVTRDSGPVVEADLEDYTKITLPRRRLARWCKEPFFKKAVLDYFVRLLIGDHDGKKCYRLCKIVEVIKGKKSYKFPPTSSREKPVSFNIASSFASLLNGS